MINRRSSYAGVILLIALSVLYGTSVYQDKPVSAYDAPPKDQGHSGPNSTGSGTGGPGGPGGSGGDPVDIASGSFSYAEQDFLIAGPGLPISLIRYYNTFDLSCGPLGNGWTFDPFMRLTVTSEGATIYIIVKRADGISLRFKDNNDGTYTPPACWYDTLAKSGSGYRLTAKGGVDYNFDSGGKLTSINDRSNNPLTFTYDGSGKILSIGDSTGRSLTIAYSSNKISTITDHAGRAYTYGYDANNNLVSVTNPINRTQTYTYDSKHRLLTIVDPGGVTLISNTYDTQGRVTTQSYGVGSFNFTYSPQPSYNNGTTSIRNRGSNYFTVYYNDIGSPTQLIDPAYNYFYLTYDAGRRVTRISDPDGYTDFTYDSRGNVTSVITPSAARSSFLYEGTYDQITATVNPLNRTTRYSYDGSGNLSGIITPLTETIAITYDAIGKLSQVSAPGGKVIAFSHSAAGYLTNITETYGTDIYAARFEYDAVGNVTRAVSPSGRQITMAYNTAGKITSVEDSAASPPKTIAYAYTLSGNIAKITETGYVRSFDYNNNRISGIHNPDGTVVTLGYTNDNAYSSIVDARGTTSYTYSSTDRVTRVTNPDASQVNITYSNDKVTRVQATGVDLQFTYDNERRLTLITDAINVKSYSFAYDAAGNRTSMNDAGGFTTYTYDALNRLVSSTAPDLTTTNYPLTVPPARSVMLNDIISAYNFSSTNRLINLILAAVNAGVTVPALSFEYPNVRQQYKSIEANKRWHYYVAEETRDKRGYLKMRSPFELMK